MRSVLSSIGLPCFHVVLCLFILVKNTQGKLLGLVDVEAFPEILAPEPGFRGPSLIFRGWVLSPKQRALGCPFGVYGLQPYEWSVRELGRGWFPLNVLILYNNISDRSKTIFKYWVCNSAVSLKEKS